MARLPIIGITMGDPSGVGPEVIAKTLSDRKIYKICLPLVIGNELVMSEGIRIAKTGAKINNLSEIQNAHFKFGVIDVLQSCMFDITRLKYGEVQAESGRAAGQCIEKAIALALEQKIDAVVTAPINKEAFHLGGYSSYPGHTEMFAALTNTKNYSMLLIYENLRIAHVTTHVSMKRAVELITTEHVLNTINVAHNACMALGIKAPKIGVAGLNPHAGEGGIFGDEEEKIILPAVKLANERGLIVTGPLPADSIFPKAQGGLFDVVVVMYHDQGHIPLKLASFIWDAQANRWGQVGGVNVTFGLPIIRTSVGHGTAFGKAGKGIADESSMKNAIEIAVTLARNKEA